MTRTTAVSRGFIRNGILTRIEQNYDSGRIGDLDGNTSTVQWNPRGCVKGFTFQRRVHGPYRLKHPMIRAGWKRWADDDFPALDEAAAANTNSIHEAQTPSNVSNGTTPITTPHAAWLPSPIATPATRARRFSPKRATSPK